MTGEGETDKPAVRDPAIEPDAIAFQIQRARVDLGLSIVELGRLTGISKTVLHGYERGRTKPGAREIRLLCSALKISPNRLIFGNDSFESSTPRFTDFYRKLRARPELAHLVIAMMMPSIVAILDEEEMQGLLRLVTALINARNPEFASGIVTLAEKVMDIVSAVTLPDGASIISPDEMQALIEKVQKDAAITASLSKLNVDK